LVGVEWRDHDASKGERRDREPRGGRERWRDGMVKFGRSVGSVWRDHGASKGDRGWIMSREDGSYGMVKVGSSEWR
jgi:hypothetical protein